MQGFYEQLFVETGGQGGYLYLLRVFTQLSLTELRAIKVEYLWELWA